MVSTIGKLRKGTHLFAEKCDSWGRVQTTAEAWYDGKNYHMEIYKRSETQKFVYESSQDMKTEMKDYAPLKQWQPLKDE